MNSLNLSWGVTSLYLEKIDKESISIDNAKKIVLDAGLANIGDMVIFMSGTPFSDKSRVNWLRFEVM